MSPRGILVVAAVGVAACVACGEEIRVKGERVNLRARPIADSEVVAQAEAGAVLTVVRSEPDWLEVRAPTNASVWVKAEFVKDGVVVSDRVNLRCGPGLSFRDLGSARRGDRLSAVETRGGWVRVIPPPVLTVWVNRSLTEPATPAALAVPVPEVVDAVQTAEVAGVAGADVATRDEKSRRLPDGINREQLAPVLGQGAVIERQGLMERVPLAFVRGVEFRLVSVAGDRKSTVCFVRAEEARVLPMLGRRCAVKGRGYWLRGGSVPLIYADGLTEVGAAE